MHSVWWQHRRYFIGSRATGSCFVCVLLWCHSHSGQCLVHDDYSCHLSHHLDLLVFEFATNCPGTGSCLFCCSLSRECVNIYLLFCRHCSHRLSSGNIHKHRCATLSSVWMWRRCLHIVTRLSFTWFSSLSHWCRKHSLCDLSLVAHFHSILSFLHLSVADSYVIAPITATFIFQTAAMFFYCECNSSMDFKANRDIWSSGQLNQSLFVWNPISP